MGMDGHQGDDKEQPRECVCLSGQLISAHCHRNMEVRNPSLARQSPCLGRVSLLHHLPQNLQAEVPRAAPWPYWVLRRPCSWQSLEVRFVMPCLRVYADCT